MREGYRHKAGLAPKRGMSGLEGLLRASCASLAISSALAFRAPEVCAQAPSAPSFFGSTYGEAGFSAGVVDEQPVLANLGLGYNALQSARRGHALLLPSFRFLWRHNLPQFYWDNYVDLGVGVEVRHSPILLGAEAVQRNSASPRSVEGEFFRFWGSYWDRWDVGWPQPGSPWQIYLWGADYAEAQWNTLFKKAGGLVSSTANLDILRLKAGTLSLTAAYRVSLDAEKRPWSRQGQLEGGLSMRAGQITIAALYGFRHSFGEEAGGSYAAARFSLWSPISDK